LTILLNANASGQLAFTTMVSEGIGGYVGSIRDLNMKS
jgi:hypothetical protein